MTTQAEPFVRPAPPPSVPAPSRAAEATAAALNASPAADFTAPVHPLTRLCRAGLLYFALGFSVTLAVQFFLMPDLAAYAKGNTITREARRLLVGLAVGGGVSACLPPLVFLLARRTAAAFASVERVGRVLCPLLLSCALPFFFDWRVFRDNELMCVLSASIFGLALERAFRVSFSSIEASWWRSTNEGLRAAYPRLARHLPAVTVGGVVVAFGAYFSFYSVQHHYNLLTTSWDLAIFDNMMWNLLRGKWFKASPDLGRVGSHIQYHATFDAFLFLPFYAIRQRADTLLVLQAVLAGAGAIPLYLLAKRRLQSALLALCFVYAYAIHAPLHQPIFYDFHFLTTAPFFIGWVLYAFETNKRGWLVVAYVVAVLLREDQSATLATAALFYLLAGDRPWWAFIGGIVSGGLFVLLKFAVMPLHVNGIPKESFTWMYTGLIPKGEGGFGAILKTVLTNPIYTLQTLIVQEKFQYIMKMFAPALFLSVRSSRAWVLHLAPFIFTMLSTGYSPLVQTYFQYTANWTSYLFFGAIVTMSGWRALPDGRVRIGAAAAAMVVTATALSYNYGAIFQHHTFRGGFTYVKFHQSDDDKKNLRDLYELIAAIPKKASVAATEHEAPHVSNREDCFTMRFGYDDADYLLVNLSEGRSGPSHEEISRAIKTGKYGFWGQRGNYVLWGKGVPTDKNADGARIVNVTL